MVLFESVVSVVCRVVMIVMMEISLIRDFEWGPMETLPRDFSPSRAISERIAAQSAPTLFSKEYAPGGLGAEFL